MIHRGFRYELRPTPSQAETLRQWCGVTRLVYNLALEQRRDFWRQYRRLNGRNLHWIDQSREVTALREEFAWIAAVPRAGLEQALRDLDKAFAAFFRGGGFPTPRRKGANDTIRLASGDVKVRRLNAKWSDVWLPKIGWMRFRDTRPMRGRLLSATVSLKDGGWWISFAREIEHEAPVNKLPAVGIDRGVVQTLTLSTGEFMQVPDVSALTMQRRRAQRALARCRKGSARRAIAKARLAALHARTARVRADWCHRASTDIARRFGLVAMEDLKIQNMTGSAKGTSAAPGRNVRQKAGLNRSILEQCWGQFAQHLDYKLAERGGHLISVPAPYTSQTCASCGVVDHRSRESQAVFRCVHCGHADNADVNAAKEILRRSTAWLGVEGPHCGPAEAPIKAAIAA